MVLVVKFSVLKIHKNYASKMHTACLVSITSCTHVHFISIVEEGATTVGIHFTDTKEDASLELGDVYPLGEVCTLLIFCAHRKISYILINQVYILLSFFSSLYVLVCGKQM